MLLTITIIAAALVGAVVGIWLYVHVVLYRIWRDS